MGQDNDLHVYYPNNLAAFVSLLVHVHGVGFPSHWISNFLSNILTNTLISDVSPYLGPLPIPISERNRRVAQRKVNLQPWHADLENILAVSYDAFPFPISLPESFARSHHDIISFSVRAPMNVYKCTDEREVTGLHDPVLALLFFKPSDQHSADTLAKNIDGLLEGRVKNSDKVQILTVVDEVDVYKGVIRWKMSRARAQKMKDEGWVMAPYSFDKRESGVYFSSCI
ncbi:hypothetical protein EIP91_002654 [Steccherinum ochraceum]|uniref:Uncharacterized protein n=1 Tax=Steccherinum ochraceum TaxID=92696 RepID=A0A4R0RTC6_9APHY|nr:hypothetical protein EIP91_002654 [Steccherinum ochraceum]